MEMLPMNLSRLSLNYFFLHSFFYYFILFFSLRSVLPF